MYGQVEKIAGFLLLRAQSQTFCHMGTLMPFVFSGDYAFVNKQTRTILKWPKYPLSSSITHLIRFELTGEFNEIASFIKVYYIACYDHNISSFACFLQLHSQNKPTQITFISHQSFCRWDLSSWTISTLLFSAYQNDEQAAFPIRILHFPELGGD